MRENDHNEMLDGSIFRREVYEQRSNRWLAEVNVAQPLPAKRIISASAILCFSLLGFLALASTSRRVKIDGAILPSGGMIELAAPVAGIVSDVYAVEGDEVRAGEALVRVTSSNQTSSGSTLVGLRKTIADRRSQVLKRRDTLERQHAVELNSIDVSRELTEQEIDLVKSAIQNAGDRIQLARAALEKVRLLQADRLISDIDAGRYESDLLVRTGERSATERELVVLRQRAEEYRKARSHSQNEYESNHALIAAEIAILDAEALENTARGEVVVEAQADALVAARLVDPGQAVQSGQPVVRLVPTKSKLEAHFFVPSRAIGFLEVGQRVTFSADAFPYQKFGLQEGLIRKLSQAPLPADGEEELYRVIVVLDDFGVVHDGRRHFFKPGMRLEGEVSLEANNILGRIGQSVRTLQNYF